MERVDQTLVWKELTQDAIRLSRISLKELFDADQDRFKKYSLCAAGIHLDYSKELIDEVVMSHLLELLAAVKVEKLRDAMFAGEKINLTEKRAVLHPFLRSDAAAIDKSYQEIIEVRAKMLKFAEAIRNQQICGCSGKPFTDVVNIGIGGSDLGPKMVVRALAKASDKLKVHFVANLDEADLMRVLSGLNAETTFFIIASKTFTTEETLTNAKAAKRWWCEQLPHKIADFAEHCAAVTANVSRAEGFGVKSTRIFPFWDWVGGRFSLWSSLGLSIALALGSRKFEELLRGAAAMDQHFLTAPFSSNLPVILAVLSVWQINFQHKHSYAILPYADNLEFFPAYLQQLEMESNGKSVNFNGEKINYQTAPVVWGGIGSNSQHSFHQLLMQGTEAVALDFILVRYSSTANEDTQKALCAHGIAQSRALMLGRSVEELIAEGCDPELIPHRKINGNIASSTMILERLTPESLGALIAMYEHKIFVEGAIWQINSFDQWGVELGKKLAKELKPAFNGVKIVGLDSSTLGLLSWLN